MNNQKKLNRRNFLRGVTAGGALLAAPSLGGLERAFAQQTGQKRKPNIVFILADDLGWGDVGVYGNGRIKTPSLDKMAREGTLWTNYHCNGSVCSPSRAAFMTGRFPAELGFHTVVDPQNFKFGVPEFLDPKLPNIARILQTAGYATAHFGKWHLGRTPNSPAPEAYGFDESLTSNSVDKRGPKELGGVNRHLSSGRIVDETIRFAKAQGDKPFFVNVWLQDPHSKLEPNEEQLAAYPNFPAGSARRIYYSAITGADRHIGRLLGWLDESGLSKDTLVVFSSDNGPEDPTVYDYSVGNSGPFRGRKRSLYEGGIRVPLIARWPGQVPANRVDNESVLSGTDFLPTFCALAGVPAPKNADLRGQTLGRFCADRARRVKTRCFGSGAFIFSATSPTKARNSRCAMENGNS